MACRHDLADRWLREVLVLRGQIGEANHPWAAGNRAAVAMNLRMAGNIDAAREILDAIPPRQAIPGAGDPDSVSRRILAERVRLLLAEGEGAAAWGTLEKSTLQRNQDPTGRAEHERLVGEALCSAGRASTGLEVLTAQAQLDDETASVAAAPWLVRARAVAGLCALSAGNSKVARQLAAQARAAFTTQPGVSPYYKAPLFKLERALGLRLPPV